MPDIPGNSATTSTIVVGGSASDSLEFITDHDWFRIELTAGQKLTITLDGITLEDPYLRVRDASGNLLAENDDINPGLVRDSQIVFTAPSTGTYYLDVGAWDENYTGTYQLNVDVWTPPVYWTYEQIGDQLTSGYWGGDEHAFNVTQGGTITVNLTALNTNTAKNLAREALTYWSDVIGITFTEVTTGGQITFDDNQSGAFSDGIWSGGIISSAHVNVSTQWLTDYGTSINTYGFQTYVHEIGHALGLGHAGMYNETATYADDALYLNDSWPSTIMSYFDQQEATYYANQGASLAFVSTPMLGDIRAMATLYGLSTTTRTGDTTYGFGNNSGRSVYTANLSTITAYTIVDSGGIDTLNYSGYDANQQIHLRQEIFSDVGGGQVNVAIGFGTVIENAIGGSGNDELVGNEVDNVLNGGGGDDALYGQGGNDTLIGSFGNDRLDGENGVDTASYATASAGVNVNLATGSAASIGGGDAALIGTDMLVTIENITGGNFGDTLTGDGSANRIDGGGGNDTIVGGGGDDVLIGGTGTDGLTGGAGGDSFQGTASGLSGDTIADLQAGDKIVITDANLAGFAFNLAGSSLTYTGGSLTLQGAISGTLVASAAIGGGVQLSIQTVVPINDVRNDFNGDGRSDILWRNDAGQLSDWLGQANGGFVTNDANAFASVPTNWHIAGTGDFNGDTRDDILWRSDAGQLSNWLGQANGGFVTNDANAFTTVPTNWHVVGTGDFNGDGRDDILWRNDAGQLSDWLGTATGGFTTNDANAFSSVPTNWHVAGTGDFNGDGRDDILWRNDAGQLSDWLGLANGGFVTNDANAFSSAPTSWHIAGTGDFNGDGRDDILWRSDSGQLSNWLAHANGNGGFVANDANAFTTVPTNWQVDAIGDYNGDGFDDILWRSDSGQLSNWLGTASGGFTNNDANAFSNVPTNWHVQPDDLLV